MLRLLLDEHLSQEIAEQVRVHNPQIPIVSIHTWRGGIYCGKSDDVILEAAHTEQLTLVTYDQRTIRPLIGLWGEEGHSHSGLIMVSERTIRSNNLGALVRSLLALWERRGHDDWTDQLLYLVD
ncbi:MAG: DUF5615 family PIN-like protein [Thermomicrobiales bacterium]